MRVINRRTDPDITIQSSSISTCSHQAEHQTPGKRLPYAKLNVFASKIDAHAECEE